MKLALKMVFSYTLSEMPSIATLQYVEITLKNPFHPFGTIFANLHGHGFVEFLFVKYD